MIRRGVWLAVLAFAFYLAGVMVWIGYDRRSAREAFPPGSVFNTGEEGLSLAYAYLRQRSVAVSVLQRRVSTDFVPAKAVLFRVRPTELPLLLVGEEEDTDEKDEDTDDKDKKSKDAEEKKPVPLLTPDEEAWVRGGGRLVLALNEDYGPVEVTALQGKAAPPRKVFPLWPGVSALRMKTRRGLGGEGIAGGHAVVLAGGAPVVSRLPMGAGDVILLACPEVFQNLGLGDAHHLALLESLAGLGEGRPVLFDERAHGLGDAPGVLETLGAWGLGPLLLLGLLAAVAAFWRGAVRIGPADREERDTRSESVELLDSLADLYDRALGRDQAVRLYQESFIHTVAAETGLRGAALQTRAYDLLGPDAAPQDKDLSRERFDRALRGLNQAFRRLRDAKRK
ncbi:MAG TPA: hypothetical protein VF756_17800 [Thermoanaerobaculia bacterium]